MVASMLCPYSIPTDPYIIYSMSIYSLHFFTSTIHRSSNHFLYTFYAISTTFLNFLSTLSCSCLSSFHRAACFSSTWHMGSEPPPSFRSCIPPELLTLGPKRIRHNTSHHVCPDARHHNILPFAPRHHFTCNSVNCVANAIYSI